MTHRKIGHESRTVRAPRGAVTEVEKAEDLRVGVPPDDGGGVGRAPARHDVDEVEGRDRDDRLVDQDQRQRRPEVRQSHEAEAVPAAAPARVILRIVVATPLTSSSVSVNQARLLFCKGGGIVPVRSRKIFCSHFRDGAWL